MSRRDQQDQERTRLADELAGLTAEIKALRTERDKTGQLADLQRQIETLKIEKARQVEDNDRKIRETEHKVGLLKTKQDHDVQNAKRETKLEVREENLAADKERFKAEMDFQREHLQREVDRIESILKAVMERLPVIEASLDGHAVSAKKA